MFADTRLPTANTSAIQAVREIASLLGLVTYMAAVVITLSLLLLNHSS